jgi:hypothetical protein
MPHRVRSSPAGPLPKIAATYVRVPIRAWSPPDRFWAGINYSIGYDDSNWSVRLRNPHNLPADSLVVISCWCLRHGRRLQFVVAPRTWPCRRQTPQHVCLSLRRCDLDRNAFEYSSSQEDDKGKSRPGGPSPKVTPQLRFPSTWTQTHKSAPGGLHQTTKSPVFNAAQWKVRTFARPSPAQESRPHYCLIFLVIIPRPQFKSKSFCERCEWANEWI